MPFLWELVKAAFDSLFHCRSLGASLSFVRRGGGRERRTPPFCSWDFCRLKDPKRRRGSRQNSLFLFGFPFRIGCEEHPEIRRGESAAPPKCDLSGGDKKFFLLLQNPTVGGECGSAFSHSRMRCALMHRQGRFKRRRSFPCGFPTSAPRTMNF